MSQIEALEQQLKDAKELVARRDLALRLGQNRDFRKLILEDFIITEASRLVAQSADPVLSAKEQQDALNMAQAGGHLKRYLSMMVMMGNSAESSIPDIEQALIEVRSEGDDD